MILQALTAVLRGMNEAGARYLVVGGLAVNAYGYVRTTQDIDLVIALDGTNVKKVFEALQALGYRPIIPVSADQLADAEQRDRWIREKEMTVLSLFSNDFPGFSVDLFVDPPFDFDVESMRALRAEVAEGVEVPFVALDTLIRMKETAGRHRDLDDLEHLQWIQQEDEDDV